MKRTYCRGFAVLAVVFGVALCVAPQANAGRWGVEISPGGWGVHYGSRHGGVSVYSGPGYYVPPRPYYAYPPAGPYYPVYYNPVVPRDVSGGGYYAPDGTYHSGDTVVDRRSSYYSPGRNQVITPPRTSVSRSYGPYGTERTRERTTWIGADGLPHSTTIDRTTNQDIWGNTHTDTHVTLKNKVQSDSPKLMPPKKSGESSNTNKTPAKK